MLVLSRKKHEKIILTKDDLEIEICLVKVKGNRALIGINAPKDIKISRQELLETQNES